VRAFSSPKEIAETVLDASGAAAEVMRLMNDRLNTYPHSQQYPFRSAEEFPPERDVSGEPPRVGVFLCTCAGTISRVIDPSELLRQVTGWPGVAVAEVVDLACFPNVLEHMREVIQSEQLNRVVVAACSNRTHESLFQRTLRMAGLNPYLLEQINLQEQSSNVHRNDRPRANRKAAEMLRLAVGRVSLAEPIHKEKHLCRPAALIIGVGCRG
jgi:heterodisulfide reductase subunit A2